MDLYRASPLERIALIRAGVDAAQVKHLLADLAVGQGAGFEALNLSAATVNKKVHQGQRLSPAESERVIGCARLVGQLEAMVEESGVEESGVEESGEGAGFNAAGWMARWLTEPLPALGGVRPVELMDTMEGQALVSSVLAKLQTGAYA